MEPYSQSGGSAYEGNAVNYQHDAVDNYLQMQRLVWQVSGADRSRCENDIYTSDQGEKCLAAEMREFCTGRQLKR